MQGDLAIQRTETLRRTGPGAYAGDVDVVIAGVPASASGSDAAGRQRHRQRVRGARDRRGEGAAVRREDRGDHRRAGASAAGGGDGVHRPLAGVAPADCEDAAGAQRAPLRPHLELPGHHGHRRPHRRVSSPTPGAGSSRRATTPTSTAGGSSPARWCAPTRCRSTSTSCGDGSPRWPRSWAPVTDPATTRPPRRITVSWTVTDTGVPKRAVLLVSKELHCLHDLLGRVAAGELPVRLEAVIGNHDALEGDRARARRRLPPRAVPGGPRREGRRVRRGRPAGRQARAGRRGARPVHADPPRRRCASGGPGGR